MGGIPDFTDHTDRLLLLTPTQTMSTMTTKQIDGIVCFQHMRDALELAARDIAVPALFFSICSWCAIAWRFFAATEPLAILAMAVYRVLCAQEVGRVRRG